MEASIMDGNTMKCGAVSGLTTVVNAVSLARLVMDHTPHIYLAFGGAEEFARQQVGVSLFSSSCLHQFILSLSYDKNILETVWMKLWNQVHKMFSTYLIKLSWTAKLIQKDYSLCRNNLTIYLFLL